MTAPSAGIRRRTRIGTRLLAVVAVGALGLGAAHESASADDKAAPRDRSPFTGLAARQGPVLAVKFDNARSARPHTGIAQADIVYVEKVEGGVSRLMGVYSSRIPKTLGPVRSARKSDVELLRQFGRPALAYSGVRSSLKKMLRESPLYIRPHSRVPSAYFRSAHRPAPHDLFVHPKSLLSSAPKASLPTDIGFRFGPAPAGGYPAQKRTVRYSSASHTFRWSPRQGRWLASFDGVPARTTSGARRPRTSRRWAAAGPWSCATARRTAPVGSVPRPPAVRPSRVPAAPGCRSPAARSGWCTRTANR